MRQLLQSRLTRLAVLGWVALFFVVVVPGHRRGMVQLPGAAGASEAAAGGASIQAAPYCPLCVLMPLGSASGADGQRPVPVDAPVTCAICFLKANLETPPPLVLPPVFVAELDYLLNSAAEAAAVDALPQWRVRGRAPPTFAA